MCWNNELSIMRLLKKKWYKKAKQEEKNTRKYASQEKIKTKDFIICDGKETRQLFFFGN